MKKRSIIPFLIYAVVIFLLVGWSLGLFEQKITTVPYSEALQQLEQENVSRFEVQGNIIVMELYEFYYGQRIISASLPDPQGFLREMNDEHVLLSQGEKEWDLPRKAVAQVRLVPDLSALEGAEDEI